MPAATAPAVIRAIFCAIRIVITAPQPVAADESRAFTFRVRRTDVMTGFASIGRIRAASMIAGGFGASLLFCAHAQAQAYEPSWMEIEDANDSAKAAVCQVMGICGGSGGSAQSFIAPPDPCFIAQNAMRPCTAKAE